MSYYPMIQRAGLGDVGDTSNVYDVLNSDVCNTGSSSYDPDACAAAVAATGADVPVTPTGETPPIVSDKSGGTFTLPVEVFERVKAILVGRPSPVMAPIPTSLPPNYVPSMIPPGSISGGVLAAAILGLLALTGRRKK